MKINIMFVRLKKLKEQNACENVEDGYEKCHDCKKFGTPECPTSSKCLAFDSRPYFESKH